jgi:hypothetical protein
MTLMVVLEINMPSAYKNKNTPSAQHSRSTHILGFIDTKAKIY